MKRATRSGPEYQPQIGMIADGRHFNLQTLL